MAQVGCESWYPVPDRKFAVWKVGTAPWPSTKPNPTISAIKARRKLLVLICRSKGDAKIRNTIAAINRIVRRLILPGVRSR